MYFSRIQIGVITIRIGRIIILGKWYRRRKKRVVITIRIGSLIAVLIIVAMFRYIMTAIMGNNDQNWKVKINVKPWKIR